MIGELLVEIIVQRIIVRFFGYYTLVGVFTIFSMKEKLAWLKRIKKNDLELEFSRGCLIGIVGIISFCLFIFLLAWIFDVLLE